MFHGSNVMFVGINHLIGGMQRNAIFPAHSQTHLLAQQAHMARLQQAQRHNHGQVTTYIKSISNTKYQTSQKGRSMVLKRVCKLI